MLLPLPTPLLDSATVLLVPARRTSAANVTLTVVGRRFGEAVSLTVGGVPCGISSIVLSEDGTLKRITCDLPPTPGGLLLVQGHDPILGNSAGKVFLQSDLGERAQVLAPPATCPPPASPN